MADTDNGVVDSGERVQSGMSYQAIDQRRFSSREEIT
jgi:hypothetical protein